MIGDILDRAFFLWFFVHGLFFMVAGCAGVVYLSPLSKLRDIKDYYCIIAIGALSLLVALMDNPYAPAPMAALYASEAPNGEAR